MEIEGYQVKARDKRKERKLKHKGKNHKKKSKYRFLSKYQIAEKKRHLDLRNLDDGQMPKIFSGLDACLFIDSPERK